MKGTFTLILYMVMIGFSQGQKDSAFVQAIVTFDHRMAHPGLEDIGMPIEELDLEYDQYLLDSFYHRILDEKKAFIISQIGHVDPELICQHLLQTKCSEEEIFSAKEKFEPHDLNGPYGRQVLKISDYVAKKKSIIGEYFLQFTAEDRSGNRAKLPNIQAHQYVLIHFYTSFCQSCKEKNHYFQENQEAFAAKNIMVVNVCTDYFPRNWKKQLENESFHNTHLYINRVQFMDLSEHYTLELSSTVLLDYTYTIVGRDKYKLEEIFDETVFE